MSQSLFSPKWLLKRTGSDESIAPSSSEEDQRYNTKLGRLPRPPSRGGGGATLSAAAKTFGTAAEAAWSGPKLAQEIHDEFLVCKICLDGYKTPKCLGCLHTFCEQCIENHVNSSSESIYKKYSDYREFTCPVCRKRTALPVGGVRKLPDNFLVSSLTEMVGRQRSSSQHPSSSSTCDICRRVSGKQREATAKCVDCVKLLCSNCVEMHKNVKVTSAHSVFDVEIEKEIECKTHQGEAVRFYCESCDCCICVLCPFVEHRDHAIMQFGEAAVTHRPSVQALMGRCREKADRCDAQIEALTRCEQTVMTVEQVVHDTAARFIQEIRNSENRLIEELHNFYGQTLMEAIRNKKHLVAQAETLRSTCSLTDVILNGKDFELLLLKREVEEKLNALNSLELESLPDVVNKVVELVVGSVDVGCIRDCDQGHPPPSNERNRRTHTPDASRDPIEDRLRNDEIIRETQQEDQKKTTKPESKDDESSSSHSGSDSDSDDGETKSKDETKAGVKEMSVQTEDPDDPSSTSSSSDSDDDDEPETEELGTMTDSVETEDRGVDTTKATIDSPTA